MADNTTIDELIQINTSPIINSSGFLDSIPRKHRGLSLIGGIKCKSAAKTKLHLNLIYWF